MSDSDTSTHRIDDELRRHVARAFKFDDPPETFEAFWGAMMRTFTDALGRDVTIEDLCVTETQGGSPRL
ncbi:hypothetical protein [Halobaculum sp. EA56]|uniref:hypothetical protein n=1 Tax=Halobaculum sp. EA56 TaxID=3421648 RepID=UPI003EBB1253